MNIFSLSFIFLFLPVSVFLFYVTPNRLKFMTLSVISVGYCLLEFGNVPTLFLVGSILIDYFIGIQIGIYPPKSFFKRLFLCLGIGKNLLLFVLANVYQQAVGLQEWLGISIVALTGIGYLADVYCHEILPEYNLIRYLSYGLFFPRLYIGPLVEYGEVRAEFTHFRPSLTGMSNGIVLFIAGMAKKVIIADGMVELYQKILQIPKEQYSVLTGWVLMIAFAFSLYFTLSSFTDVARGLGLIFALRLPSGFYYPFQARSIDEFFARFNITVNEFVRKYVYVRLGEKNNGFLSASCNMILVSMLISMWYGISLNSLLWGIYLAVFIVLEQYVYGKQLRKLPAVLARGITFCITMMSFSVLHGSSLEETVFYLKTMFGLNNNPITDMTTLYLLSSNYLLIVFGFLLCTSIGVMVGRFFSKRFPVLGELFGVAFHIFLLICISAFLL